ncbi:MAG: RidA family protein [Gaiella sp.]|nr:RidA family protein [Gaiella sp.]
MTAEPGKLTVEHIHPPELFRHPAFTRVITVAGPMKLVFIAGQTSTDEHHRVVAPGDYLGQYRQVMESLAVQLRAAGATWDSVVYRRVFTLDVDAMKAVELDPSLPRWWDPEKPPASSLIGVTRLAEPEYLLEVELFAVVEP